MQSSTPINSPARRRLQCITIEDDNLDTHDREHELRGRRLEAINRSNQQERIRKSVIGLNTSQLTQHSLDCIKLSAENKINAKNAFSLLLIDVMAAMAKRSDSEINKNFQVASCTLDASVKIYGYRVDALHGDAMKIAGEFIRSDALDLKEENDSERDDSNNQDADVLSKKKLKRKARKATIVPADSLNSKSESETLLDAVPRPCLLTRQSKNIASELLTRVPKINDSSLIVVESDQPVWPYKDKPTDTKLVKAGESFDTGELKQLLDKIDLLPTDKLCSAIDIEFGKDRDEDSEESHLNLSQRSTYEFDINASVIEQCGETAVSEQQRRFNLPGEGYNSDEEIMVPELSTHKNEPVTIMDMKRKLSVQPMEYSFFDKKVFQSWAGPTYWRVRPSKTNFNDENKENEDASQPVGSKRTRKTKVKEPPGLFDVSIKYVESELKSSDKTVLVKSTLFNWKSSNLTLAEDYKFNEKDLFSLYYLPFYTVPPKHDVSNLEVDVEDHVDDINAPDQHQEHQELEYCSQSLVTSEPRDISANRSALDVEEWGASNMVEAPNKVQQIKVETFQKRKNVDMKQLKRGIWSMLTENDVMKKPVNFSELFNSYPSKLPPKIATGLSAPLLFNALLHLTNEKSLVLKQSDSFCDFTISQ